MCGIFGIFGHPEASHIAYLGLHALQHRGQESAGMTASDGQQLRTWRAMGSVVDVFDEPRLDRLAGHAALGHVRYSTAGDSDLVSAQPLAVTHNGSQLALVHNGNLVSAATLRRRLEEGGSIFTSTADSEVFVHLFARCREGDLVQRITSVLAQVQGAYSLIFLTPEAMVVARDPHGFRPLSLGRVPNKDGSTAWVVASENCAFELIGAEYERSVAPGEIIRIDNKGLHTQQAFEPQDRRFCVFEHIYFARPDSVLGDRSVYHSRECLGEQLAKERPVDADIVIPIPDSGTAAALGYSGASGIPFGMGLVRSHYIGRTFIEPRQSIRHFGVRLKLAPVRHLIAGKRVCAVDDSLVRGTTSKKIVSMLRAAGAKEVHLRISAPPTRHPCHYGIDTPSYEELIAAKREVDEIAASVGCDSLGFLSIPGMLEALGGFEGPRFCDACFSGNYPVAP